MVKKNSPNSDTDTSSNINKKKPIQPKLDIKSIQKELKKLQTEFKSSKTKISTLEKENKSLKKNINTLTTWKKNYESIDKTFTKEEDINKKLPFLIMDMMKNINHLNTFNLSLINESTKRRKNSESDDNSDYEYPKTRNSFKRNRKTLNNNEYDEDYDEDYDEEYDEDYDEDYDEEYESDNSLDKKELIKFNKNKKSSKIKEPIVDRKTEREIKYFIDFQKQSKQFEELPEKDKAITLYYLELFLKNDKLQFLSKKDISYFLNLSLAEKTNIYNTEIDLSNLNDNSVPPRFKIINSSLPITIKNKCLTKLNMFKNIEPGSSEYNKLSSWINGILAIPWSTYKPLPVSVSKNTEKEIYSFLETGIEKLNDCVYGQNKTKQHMIQLVSKIISNPKSVGNVFSIYGPMGTGKTTIIKEGLSKLLGLPFIFISLGGATDSSFLDGHSYTYEGSIPGRIVEALKTTKCMNPIFYFDELDKVSETSRGLEIINLLIHLTDPAQNSHYQDKYYGDIPFDLSKALFVFSFNNINRVNPILRDRMNLIKVDGFTFDEKLKISSDFLLPSILKEYNIMKDEILFSDDILKYIINKNDMNNQKEEGVRGIKKRIETIVSNINVIKIAFMKQKNQSQTIKKRLRKKQKTAKKNNDESLVIKEDENTKIDISLVEKILPTIKSKLSSYNETKLENIIKNLKTPITITPEIVDLFLTKTEQPSIPMFMYT